MPVATPTSAPAATATPAAPACPMDQDACTLARFVQPLVARVQTDLLANANRVQTHTCPGGRPQGPGGPYPLCDGAPANEQRQGMSMARRYSEGNVVSPLEYQRIISQLLSTAVDMAAADAYGPGAMQLYAVSCADAAASPADCSRFAAIFSGIIRQGAVVPPLGVVPGREVLVFYGAPPAAGQTTPVITETWTGVIQPGEKATILQTGGTLFDLGRIFPYR